MEDDKVLISIDFSMASEPLVELLLEESPESSALMEIVNVNRQRPEILLLIRDHANTPEDIRQNLIIGPLQKSRIDGHDGFKSLRRHAGCKGHRMLLGNSDVIKSFGIESCKMFESCTFFHRREKFVCNRIIAVSASRASVVSLKAEHGY